MCQKTQQKGAAKDARVSRHLGERPMKKSVSVADSFSDGSQSRQARRAKGPLMPVHEIVCSRCGSPVEESPSFASLPALTRCPACGLALDEVRTPPMANRPRPQLESDLARLDEAQPRGRAAALGPAIITC